MPRKADEHDLFARIPKWLWDALRAEARAENRSATAQLVVLLKSRYGPRVKRARRGGDGKV